MRTARQTATNDLIVLSELIKKNNELIRLTDELSTNGISHYSTLVANMRQEAGVLRSAATILKKLSAGELISRNDFTHLTHIKMFRHYQQFLNSIINPIEFDIENVSKAKENYAEKIARVRSITNEYRYKNSSHSRGYPTNEDLYRPPEYYKLKIQENEQAIEGALKILDFYNQIINILKSIRDNKMISPDQHQLIMKVPNLGHDYSSYNHIKQPNPTAEIHELTAALDNLGIFQPSSSAEADEASAAACSSTSSSIPKAK